MNHKEILKQEAAMVYGTTEVLFERVSDADLEWKPSSGDNWMTTGQLLMHCTNACGSTVKGFITGDWGMPEGVDVADVESASMMPKAEALPAVSSVAEAKSMLAEDRKIAMRLLDQVAESDLTGKSFAAPWGGPELTLFQHLLSMIHHLSQHKGQLFYYLKLQGQPVNTHHLWGY